MKTSEFKSVIESEGYHIIERPNYFRVGNNTFISTVDRNNSGIFKIYDLPDKVAEAVMNYAYTPIEERKDKKRWNVIIGEELEKDKTFYTAWLKGEIKPYFTDDAVTVDELNDPQNIFTDSEFNELIEHLRKLPNGDTYAKIAELGKREAVTDAVD